MFQAYHGVTAAQHQTSFNTLSGQGYRMISLSVYGDPGNALYAAVWVQRTGPAYAAVHGVDAAGYQSFFNTWTAKGYAPVIVSATGTISNAVFAAVFEQGIGGPWMARHGMTDGSAATPGTFQYENAAAAAGKMILRSVAIYGTGSDRRYAAVWHPNPGYVKWHVHPSNSGADYQTAFNAETQLPGYGLAGYRPAYVSVSGDVMYSSVFKDDVVGPWVARHGMSGAEYQAEFNQQVAQGLYPICTQGGGSTSSPVYAAIFAKQDIPSSRTWTISGAAVPSLASVDQMMQTLMRANAIRAAQISIARGGVIKFSRGYTWAEPGYRQTQPTDRFLLASCSKMFLEAAVQALYDAKQLTPTTTVYPLLGFKNPLDPRSDTITIQQLLDHAGGYDDSSAGSGFDPTYHMREIGAALGHVVSTKLDVAHYMYGKMLDFTPGTKAFPQVYSNFGYLLAGAVVEHVTGKSYYQYVNSALFQPIGISEVRGISTLASGRSSDEAIAEDQGLGLNPLNLSSQLLVPNVYGGDGEINEVGDPNDGMGASAEALARFINFHAVFGNGPRSPGASRIGSTPGGYTQAGSRGDGVDWAYVLNTRDWTPSANPTTNDLVNLLNTVAVP